MKFGESLSEGLVPEWKDQYVQYKIGKKKIKDIAQASGSEEANDTTPLLDPTEDGVQYVPDLEEVIDEDVSQNQGKSSRRSAKQSLNLRLFPKSRKDYQKSCARFTTWLDEELEKVDSFYMEKERDVYTRFLILEDQFYQLKEQRIQLARRLKRAQEAQLEARRTKEPVNMKIFRWLIYAKAVVQPLARYEWPSLPLLTFIDNFRRSSQGSTDLKLSDQSNWDDDFDVFYRENQIRNGKVGYESDMDDDSLNSVDLALGQRSSRDQRNEAILLQRANMGDYVSKRRFGVPYFYAKRHLKEALIEHYRSIALIRSYRSMNRTAFRKITKKFDKATHLTISEEFMHRVDTKSYFQTSLMLDQILTRVEDIFLNYFDSEKGDRKHGLEKLRSATYAYNNSNIRANYFHRSVFVSGLCLGVGLPFFGIALYIALHNTLLGMLPEGKYLLQIWGGFFLVNLALFLVAINFLVYNRYKINYKFIFEFNLADALDYRQAFLLPSIGFMLLCGCAWLSFSDFWPSVLPGRTFPLIYLACVLVIFLWPGPQFYGTSRRWLQIAIWRIICSGFYPVEFRDFYIGDILCSLTYLSGNLSFFVCLYADKWRNILGGGSFPSNSNRCDSKHSRTMGFFSSLPSIWRFLQCLRRYMDTGDAFPHLANMSKYLILTLYYCFLSVWRIDRIAKYRAIFIVFACLNSIFCSMWDVVMDWSLGQTTSKNYLLRDHLFYEQPAYYYTAVVADVILRFQWIFYAFFSSQVQQLAITSFCIALAEILRRFIWMFFRMENEHCANVILFRASRDSPLPYMVLSKVERAINKLVDLHYEQRKSSLLKSSAQSDLQGAEVSEGYTTAYDGGAAYRKRLGATEGTAAPDTELSRASSRRKSTFMNISDVLNKAHIKDFQRKKYAIQADSDDEDIASGSDKDA